MGFIGFDAHIPSTSSLWFPGLARKKSEKPEEKAFPLIISFICLVMADGRGPLIRIQKTNLCGFDHFEDIYI